jgi:hypothetical protein
MNTMKGFYVSISSTSHLHGPYLEALSKITKMSQKQARALRSELGWQDWSQQHPETTTGRA